MKKTSFDRILPWVLVLGLIGYIYRGWFIHTEIVGGDWPYYYDGFLRDISLYPTLWASWLGNGMGAVNPLLGLGAFFSLTVVPFTHWLHVPWVVAYKIGWFGLFLVTCAYSSRALLKTVVSGISETALAAGVLIYTTNTYVLMLTGGGQMGIALAYALAPFVMSMWVRMMHNAQKAKGLGYAFKAGAVFAVLIAFDPRVAYGIVLVIAAYALFCILTQERRDRYAYAVRISVLCAAGGLTGLFLNAFWLLPMLMLRKNPLESLGSVFVSRDAVKFFSFADFAHALGLLHPNWPENIFGKTYFLQPVFLILPIAAFGALLITGRKSFFYAGLALIGAFLAKGANEPFGGVYLWLFERVPGFVMFRDPTKFYLLIALSYSILVPYVFDRSGRYVRLVAACGVLIWLVMIRQAVDGSLGGTFAYHAVSPAYADMREVLEADTAFSRVLWVPHQQRFSFTSFHHMAVDASVLFEATNPAQLADVMTAPTTKTMLYDIGAGYVAIPDDSLGEVFVQDRTYDRAQRDAYEAVLDRVPWLTKIRSGAIALYKTQHHRDLFSVSGGETVIYRRQKWSGYTVSFTSERPSSLLFSQRYHPGWVFHSASGRIIAQKTENGLIGFPLIAKGTYDGAVYFEPQRYVDWGVVISIISGIAVVIVLRNFHRV